MFDLNRLAKISGTVAAGLALCVALISVGAWYNQVTLGVERIPAIEEKIDQIPDLVKEVSVLKNEVSILKDEVNNLTEIMRSFIGRFDTLPADQQASLRNAIPENALE